MMTPPNTKPPFSAKYAKTEAKARRYSARMGALCVLRERSNRTTAIRCWSPEDAEGDGEARPARAHSRIVLTKARKRRGVT